MLPFFCHLSCLFLFSWFYLDILQSPHYREQDNQFYVPQQTVGCPKNNQNTIKETPPNIIFIVLLF